MATPLVREIQADSHATNHKLKFFENGATLGTVISYDPTLSPEQFQTYVKMFKDLHVGTDNAYKALHIGGGATPTVNGADLKQLDFKATQALAKPASPPPPALVPSSPASPRASLARR